MGEFIPNEPQYGFFFTVDGEQIEATPANTKIELHQQPEDAKYDYVASFYEDDEGDSCLHINWRGDLPNEQEGFDQTVYDMGHARFEITSSEQVSDSVRELYDKHHPPVESFYSELTPRQENRPRFLAFLLHHDRLIPEDFEASGDLYI